jgi:signal transduction histidine kinase
MISISLNILDIVQNSIRAGATLIKIGIEESAALDVMEITIQDNGSGIPNEILDKVTDPFVTTRTTRKTGLGLPLLKQHAILAGGDVEIKSRPGEGTSVRAAFRLSHIDRQPMGDIAGVVIILISANPEIDFLYSHKTDKGIYELSTSEIKEYLEVKSLNENTLINNIRDMIKFNLKEIGVSE